MDLIDFLRACLDEDERAAKARSGIYPSPGVDQDGTVWLHIRPGGNAVLVRQRDPIAGYDDFAKLRNWADAEHGWTQERVLRDIDAKRKLLDLHGLVHRDISWLENGEEETAEIPVCGNCVPRHAAYHHRRDVPAGPCATLRLLALPYADRPGYRDDWRPDGAPAGLEPGGSAGAG
jgi:hypothetical protein